MTGRDADMRAEREAAEKEAETCTDSGQVSLRDLGVTKKESSRWQREAAA